MFFLNLAIHLLRPGRDGIGIKKGIENLPLLFTFTFIIILILNYGLKKVKRRFNNNTIIHVQHGLVVAGIVYFLVTHQLFSSTIFLDNMFFVWVSIVNLWCISSAWDVVTDIFPRQQFLNRFGIIAFGGTLGCVAGYGFSIVISGYELFVSLVASIIAWILISRLIGYKKTFTNPRMNLQNPGSNPGVPSGFLFNYGNMIFLYALISTFLYFQQAYIIINNTGVITNYTVVFAQLGFAVNMLAMLLQIFFSSGLIKKAGAFFPIAIIPAVLIAGLVCFTLNASFSLLIILLAFNKVASFSLVRPVRETLLSTVQPYPKNQLKLFFDTIVYRGGDVLGSWLFILLFQLGIGFKNLAFVAIFFCLLWLAAIIRLRKYAALLTTNSTESKNHSV
jgi:AAA family ATP:ADP antiporter